MVNQHIQKLREAGRWMRAVPDKESFRFGNGHELVRKYSFMSLPHGRSVSGPPSSLVRKNSVTASNPATQPCSLRPVLRLSKLANSLTKS